MYCFYEKGKRANATVTIDYQKRNNIINNITFVNTSCNVDNALQITGSLYHHNIIIKHLRFIDSHTSVDSKLIDFFYNTDLVVIERSSIINSSFGNYVSLETNTTFIQNNFYMMNSSCEMAIFIFSQGILFLIENVKIMSSSVFNFISLYNINLNKASQIRKINLENNIFLSPAFYVSMSPLIIDNATLSNNHFTNENKAILYIMHGNVSISNIYFGLNYYSLIYGYIFVASESVFTAKDIVFINSSGQYANSIYSNRNKYIYLENCTFINSMKFSTDLVSFYDKEFYIRKSFFLNSFRAGMKVYWVLNKLIISSIRFENIPSYAIELTNVPFATIDSCIFNASPYHPNFNSFRMQGIYAELSNLDVRNCIFTNMRSDEDGGAISTTITFSESVLPSSSFRIWNTQFINCSASRGGAIFLSVQPKSTKTISSAPLFSGVIIKSSFVNNTASSSGGALAFICDKNKNSCKFNIADTVFTRNMVTKTESYNAVKYYYSNINSSGNVVEKDIDKFRIQVLGPPSILKLTSGNKIIRIIQEKDCINRAISKFSLFRISLSLEIL